MPSIYLKETSSYFAKFVTVTEQEYGQCKLFKYFKHQLKKPSKGPIWISNQSYPKGRIFLGFWDFWERYLTIKLDDEYKEAKLTEARVYHNQYDSDKTPLLFVLIFNNGGPKLEKYYKVSEFESEIKKNGGTKDISQLCKYQDDNSILNDLLTENDKLSEPLTYNIGKKQGDNGNGNYNGGKIKVEDDSSSDPSLTSTGFSRYKHTPQNNGGNKKACVIYNNNLLCRKDKSPINIQNQNYNYISVYFSKMVREPLLVQFNIGKSKNKNKYYYHNRDDDGPLYWNKLKRELESVFEVPFGGSKSAHTQLTESNNVKLLKLLKAIEAHLLKTIVFMIDKRTQYQISDIKSSFDNWKTYRIINLIIKPEDKTKSEGQYLCEYGYKVYVHDFTYTVKEIDDAKEKVQLRFIIPKSDNKTYNEITLVNEYFVEETEIKQILYTVCKKELYVYFYGSDPRPLLLCYNGQSFKPENMQTYTKKWCKAREIKPCECSEPGFDPSKGLLKTLYKISMFLNPVNLGETIKACGKIGTVTSVNYTYTIQEFAGKEIQIKVKAKDLQCYRVYTHSPAVSDGSTVISRGFRLGYIYYGEENNKRGADSTCLKYPQELPLQSVSLFYYMYDQPHHYPLIIQLDYGFQGPLDDYYRVCKTDSGNGAQASIPGLNGGAEVPKKIFPFQPRKS